jgi:UDP-glucuronate 4-epimerase
MLASRQGKPIRLFNTGRMKRDFTYADDVAEAVVRLIERPAAATRRGPAARLAPPPASPLVYNIGNHTAVEVIELVRLIEQATGRTAIRENLPMQPGEVPETCADVADLQAAVGFAPNTPLAEGVHRFVDWYRGYVARPDGVG